MALRLRIGRLAVLRLQISQIIHDFGAGPVLRADELAPDFALAVDDVGFGRACGAKGEVALLRLIVDGEEVDVVVGEELVVGVDVVIEVHAENDDLRHLFLEIGERGQFLKAWGAPGSPEIEDDYFAVVVGEADGSGAVNNGEVWGRRGYLSGMRAAIAAGGENQGKR